VRNQNFFSTATPASKLLVALFYFAAVQFTLPAVAQVPPPASDAATRINPGALPTDLTPLIFTGERGLLSRELKFSIFKKLPERLWFNTSTEISQRLETNPTFTNNANHPDYVFRALPNVTVGYNVLKNTGIYVNYFAIKDVYARDGRLGVPTTQSLSLGLRQVLYSRGKTSAQFDFQARELWQAAGLRQFDYLPSISLTRVVTPRTILFASSVLQMRGRNYFVAPTREIDSFYAAGAIFRRGNWNFVVSDTLVTNFRRPPFSNPVPRQGNVSMIADFEINHPINSRYLPGVLAFIRAEPVWDWRSNRVTGLSGFDFRLFTGIRIAASKPAYNTEIDSIKEQLKKHNELLKKLKKPPDSNIPQSPGTAGGQINGAPTVQQPDSSASQALTRIQLPPADSVATPPPPTRIQPPDQVADTQAASSLALPTTGSQD